MYWKERLVDILFDITSNNDLNWTSFQEGDAEEYKVYAKWEYELLLSGGLKNYDSIMTDTEYFVFVLKEIDDEIVLMINSDEVLYVDQYEKIFTIYLLVQELSKPYNDTPLDIQNFYITNENTYRKVK